MYAVNKVVIPIFLPPVCFTVSLYFLHGYPHSLVRLQQEEEQVLILPITAESMITCYPGLHYTSVVSSICLMMSPSLSLPPVQSAGVMWRQMSTTTITTDNYQVEIRSKLFQCPNIKFKMISFVGLLILTSYKNLQELNVASNTKLF